MATCQCGCGATIKEGNKWIKGHYQMVGKKYRDRDYVYQRYVVDELPMWQLAEEIGCDYLTIRKWIVKLGIHRRSVKEGHQVRRVRERMTEATRLAYEEGRRSRVYSEEHVANITRGVKAAAARGAYHTDEVRKKHSELMKIQWERGDFDGVFQSPTSIEIMIRDTFSSMGIEYVFQYRPPGHSKVYDFFIPPDILIEVQGDYWHNLPGAKEADAQKHLWALGNGFLPIEIWEHELRQKDTFLVLREHLPSYIFQSDVSYG